MTGGKRMLERFKELNQIEGVDTGLLTKALTHPSFCQENNGAENNQRLEFLGDAILNLVVAGYL